MASLGVSPSRSHFQAPRARPTPPGRSKRASLTPTSRANIAPNPSPVSADGSRRTGADKGGGVLGGLRERSEDEIKRAGREELVAALREEWAARDGMSERAERLENDRRRLEQEKRDLSHSLGYLQQRADASLNEQSRLEADVEGRDELLDKMRGRISESEKAIRDGTKRYSEQEKSFEAEREAYRAQELHLQTRIKTLCAAVAAASSSTSADVPSHRDTEQLQEELASLSAAHCTLIAQLNTTTLELADVKERNMALEEENAGWELLMRERTLNGRMRGKGLLSEDWLEGDLTEDEESLDGAKATIRPKKGRKSDLDALDEEMEASFPCDTTTAAPDHDVPLTSAKSVDRAWPVAEGAVDLASELGRVADVGSGSRMTSKADGSNSLRAEVKQLRDANKALTQYCSKIIDRIIAQEGYEDILSVDYKTRRMRSERKQARMSVTDSTLYDLTSPTLPFGHVSPPVPIIATQAPTPSKKPASRPSLEAPASSTGAKKARPLSMMAMARVFSSSPVEEKPEELVVEPSATVSVPAPSRSQQLKDEETKAAKKAKRGFSIDFRSFGFGSAAPAVPATPPEPKGLKPLQLPKRTASMASRPPSVRIPSPPLMSPSEMNARKLDPQAEDDEDRRERHRMEAAMRLMGIHRSGSPDIEDDHEDDDMPAYLSSQASASPRPKPLARLSSHFAADDDRLSLDAFAAGAQAGLDPALQEDSATAAIAAFSKREQEQAKKIAKGSSYQAGYTSPGSSARGRRESVRRGSAQSERGHVQGHGKMPKSESISTLWSAGTGSRPGSMEVQQ